MITSVTGVTRSGGIDLPTPAVRTSTTAREPSSGEPAPATATGSTGSTGSASTAVAAGAAAGKEHERQPEKDAEHTADGGAAAAATSRYLAELLTARVIGGAAPTGRPPHITPERLSSLISYLETDLVPAGTASGAAGKGSGASAKSTGGGVDVTG